jgi:ribosome-associated toxin RatA of RatAB toxin-antitoxin module
MPLVESRVVIEDANLGSVWDVMRDFEAFPRLMPDVLDVKCFDRDGETLKSAWRVLLNGSELTWVEADQFVDRKEITFYQTEGDLEVWEGTWRLRTEGRAVIVDLTVLFDLGIPSLAHILDPIGIRAIKANSRQMLEAINRNSRGMPV